MTRIGRAAVLAAGLLLVVAAPVAAGKPDIYRESDVSPMETDWMWTDACGVEIQGNRRYNATWITYGSGIGEVTYQTQRTLVGPEGSVQRRTAQRFGGPFEVTEDPDAGTVTESFKTTTTGVHTFIEVGGGKLLTEVGLSYVEGTIVWGPGDEFSITIDEEYVRGQSSGLSDEAFVALICSVLAG